MSKLPALTSFGPEVLAALVEGSRREVIIELSWADAVVLRQRMHQLRARMREDKHALASIVSAAKITIRWGAEVATKTSRKNVKYPLNAEAKVELVIRPQDSTFRRAIEKAGISLLTTVPEPLVLSPKTASDETPDDIIQDFLKGRQP